MKKTQTFTKTQTNKMTAFIDSLSLDAVAVKQTGKTAQALKDQVTAQYQWFIADYVYNPKALNLMLSEWLEHSKLVGEPRRTAKQGLCNAVEVCGSKLVKVEIVERKTDKKERGIHIDYLTDEQLEAEAYEKAVVAMVKLMEKVGQNGINDAMARVELAKQEAKDKKPVSKDVERIKLDKITAKQAQEIEARRTALLAKLA